MSNQRVMQIRSSRDGNGKRFGLGSVVSFEGRRWRVVNFYRTGKTVLVEAEEATLDPHSSITVHPSEVLS